MDYNTFTAQITKKMIETEEEFIYQSVLPFCEEITETRLSKKDLIDALVRYKELVAHNEALRERIDELKEENERLKDRIEELYKR